MVSVWWSAAGLIHYSFLNSGKTITSQKYAQQIEIHQKLQCLQLALVNRKGPVLLHNACPHIAQSVLQKLNKLGCEVMFHLPYAYTMQETWVQSLGWEDTLEKKIAIHSSILDWEIPWAEDPGRLQSMGSQKSQI